MATLNAQADDYDEAEGASSSALNSELTWNWKSWPNNLRRAVTILLGLIVAAAALTLLLQSYEQDLSQKLLASTSLQSIAQSKLMASGQERDTIVKNLPVLRELEERGIFGEEKRLEWVEQLRIIEKRWPGIGIKYEISPQKLLQKEGAASAPAAPMPVGTILPNGNPAKPFGVFSTDMKLKLDLLHEGDAFAIFEDLKAAKLGLFTVKQCNFVREESLARNEPQGDLATPVKAECFLNWISMGTYTP